MKTVLTALGVLFLTMVALSALTGVIVMWAWNAFMPTMFGLSHITFTMAFALMILISMIRVMTTVSVTQSRG